MSLSAVAGSPARSVMTPERWAIVRQVFDEVLARAPDARPEFLASACGDDDDLRAEVLSLLAADTGPAPAVLEGGSGALAAAADWVEGDGESVAGDGAVATDPGPDAGREVGPYRLVREIGRGGMGTVYLAEREDVGKRVALKLLREGRATPSAVRRLLAERRVLARLEHPRIAQLLDAGVTAGGVPYFALEYVDGAPLVAACDARRLDVRGRLGLFAQVCDAVAYAHRNLVVHRDLKPSNVLVTAEGTVKLLDFGIAKLLSAADDGDVAPLTAERPFRNDGLTSGAWLMTPQYAAPEQRRGEPVTTATDVYALGLLLRELVSGERPSAPTFSLADVALRVGEQSFSPPEARVSVARTPASVPASRRALPSTTIAQARGTTPERLRRALAGDLDAIVARATANSPTARYASADQLADDLRRHLAHRPVNARSNSRSYRVRTFLRRNRVGVASMTGLFLLLTATIVGTSVQESRTRRALAQATLEASKARQVTRFVASLLQDADPYRTHNGPPTALEAGNGLVEAARDRLDLELRDQPGVRTELLRTLAMIERNRGRFDDAERLLARGLAALPAGGAPGGRSPDRTALPGPADVDRAGLFHELGVVRRMRSDFAGADTLLTQALAIRTVVPGPDSADLAATRFELGALRRYQGRYADAEILLQQALLMRRSEPGIARAEVLDELASTRVFMGDPDGCAALVRQSLTFRERWLGARHPLVADGYTRLSTCLLNAGRVVAAEAAVRHALALQDGRLGAEHPDRIRAESQLSWILISKGSYEEAERVQRHVLEAREAVYGRGRDVAGSLYTLGYIRVNRGDLGHGIPLMQRAVDEYTAVLGPDRREVNDVRRVLGPVLAGAGRIDEAVAVTGRMLQSEGPVWDPVAQPAAWLADTLRATGRCTRALPLYARALSAYRDHRPALAVGDPHLAALQAGATACGAR